MRLVYSNADKAKTPQKNPSVSLGGFLSDTPIPNGMTNNIFPAVSNFNLQNKKPELRLIGLWNNSTTQYTDVSVTVIVPQDSIFTYSIAISAPTLCGDDDKYELVSTANAIPYYATLETLISNEPYIVGSIDSDRSVGVWLRREMKSAKKCKTSVLLNSNDCILWKEKYSELENADDSCEDPSDTEQLTIIVDFNNQENSVSESQQSTSESQSNSLSSSNSASSSVSLSL